jgi:hypothetical protein
MNLEMDDLKHCHKVLASDIEECTIISDGREGERLARLRKRIEDDSRVMARIERIIGYKPEYAVVTGQTQEDGQ